MNKGNNDVINEKHIFKVQMPIWWLCFISLGSGWYEIVSPTHALSNHDIKIGGRLTFWRAISISKMACFWSNLHYIAHSSTRGFWTLTRAHGLMKGQEWLILMEIVNCGKRNPNHAKKKIILAFSERCAHAQRAGGHVRAGNFEMLKMTWFILSFVQKVILSIFLFWCARGQGLSVCWLMTWSLCVLNLVNLWRMDMKINDNVKTQNGAWMTSWLSDHTEKLRLSIPDNDKDTVNISTWLLILFLRYLVNKIRTERRNNNEEENKIRTNSIGDMLLCSISPN